MASMVRSLILLRVVHHVLCTMCCMLCAVCWEDLAGMEVPGRSGLLKRFCGWEWGDGPQGWVDSSG